MADVSEVSQFIARRVAAVLYPEGESKPSLSGVPVKIYPGWPVPDVLQRDIEAGAVHVTVWPLPGERKVSTGLGRAFRTVAKGKPSLQVNVNGSIITLSGEVAADINVQIALGSKVFRFHFPAGITLNSVRERLSEALPLASIIFGRIMVLNAGHITASVTTAGTVVRELRRQIKEFQVTVWAPTPMLRNRIGTLVDVTLSEQHHIDLGDHAPAQMLCARQSESDAGGNFHVYRRDLVISVNFALTQQSTASEVIATAFSLNGH